MYKRKATKFRANKVSIEGHYEDQETPRGTRRVWVPDQLIVECSCGSKMRPSESLSLCECGASHMRLVDEMKSVLAENSIRLPYRDHKVERLTRVVHEASEIAHALMQETPQSQRSSVTDSASDALNDVIADPVTLDNDVDPLFSLENAVVVGKLDLKHRTIERPLEFKNCWFLDSVDLRYCEFEQAVYFLDCTFYQVFNSGDTVESHTVYRKELTCNGSHFKRAVGFNGIQVESNAYFHNSRFELKESAESPEYPSLSTDYAVDFATASFGCHIECRNAVFEGPVSFNSIRCDGNGFIKDTHFEEEANFTAAFFGRNLECPGAHFGGPAVFNSVKCGGNGTINGAYFETEANFTAASIERNLQCSNVEFKGPAKLNSLRCGGAGIINKTRFRDRVNLAFSSFGLPLVCEDSEFWGEVNCTAMTCAHDGRFKNSRFESDQRIVFAGASFGEALQCEGAVFKGRVDFRALKCGGSGHFENATFVNTDTLVDYRHSHFGGNLDLRCAYFAGRVRLSQASIKNKLRLGASRFEGEAELYDSDIKILELIDANYHLERKHPLEIRTTEERDDFATIVQTKDELERIFKPITFSWVASKLKTRRFRGRKRTVEELFPFKPNKLTLTGISFERFHGGPNRELAWELALKFCEGQDPTRFSRDPYLQLKKYYSSIGEDDDALDIHYRGRCALRKNAKASRSRSKKGRVHWSWPKIWITDSIWKWSTGYGQKMYRLLLTFAVLVAFGTAVLWSDRALTPLPEAARSVQEQQGSPKLVDRMVYSVDLLIPVLDLRAGDARIVDSVRWLYEVFLIFAGWLLIALLIAWITAVAKGDR